MKDNSDKENFKRIWREAMFEIEQLFRIWEAEQAAIDRGIYPK